MPGFACSKGRLCLIAQDMAWKQITQQAVIFQPRPALVKSPPANLEDTALFDLRHLSACDPFSAVRVVVGRLTPEPPNEQQPWRQK